MSILTATPWLVLVGPTGVGKSDVAVELALQMDGEIVSADSMQIYRGMDIGTAKPTLEEQRGVPHHLFDVLGLEQHCDVAEFRNLALEAMTSIRNRGRKPIVVGGSGLYVRALTQGLFDGPGRDDKLRAELETLSTVALRQCLLKVDEISAARIEEHDRRRIIRALECHALTGRSISSFQTQWNQSMGWPVIGLARLREELYQRCDMRVDRMFAGGFIEEVQGLMASGLEASPTAGKAIGYGEVMAFLKGRLSQEETITRVKQKTRNFVKRQLAWFRKEPGIHWVEWPNHEPLASLAQRVIQVMERDRDAISV